MQYIYQTARTGILPWPILPASLSDLRVGSSAPWQNEEHELTEQQAFISSSGGVAVTSIREAWLVLAPEATRAKSWLLILFCVKSVKMLMIYINGRCYGGQAFISARFRILDYIISFEQQASIADKIFYVLTRGCALGPAVGWFVYCLLRNNSSCYAAVWWTFAPFPNMHTCTPEKVLITHAQYIHLTATSAHNTREAMLPGSRCLLHKKSHVRTVSTMFNLS